MKRLIAAALLAVIIAVPCVAGNMCIFRFRDRLENITDGARTAAENMDIPLAKEYAEKAEKYFIEREGAVAVFSDHELIENLGVSIAKLPDLAAKETISEFLSELEASDVMLVHLVNDQKPMLRNIL